MNLKDYLQKTKQKPVPWAKSKGLSEATIWRIYNGKTRPTARIAKDIEKATGGKVSANELVFG
jgi:DNA-binding transcriptional regulator YdaS (Cro superfamily)